MNEQLIKWKLFLKEFLIPLKNTLCRDFWPFNIDYLKKILGNGVISLVISISKSFISLVAFYKWMLNHTSWATRLLICLILYRVYTTIVTILIKKKELQASLDNNQSKLKNLKQQISIKEQELNILENDLENANNLYQRYGQLLEKHRGAESKNMSHNMYFEPQYKGATFDHESNILQQARIETLKSYEPYFQISNSNKRKWQLESKKASYESFKNEEKILEKLINEVIPEKIKRINEKIEILENERLTLDNENLTETASNNLN